MSSTFLGQHPSVRRQATFHLWLLNLAFATVVGANYLWHVPDIEGAKAWLFALPALLSTTLILTIVPGFSFWILARFFRGPRALGWIQGLFWTLFQVLLFADTRVFNMFRYHMNGQVWNLIYVRGSEDSIHLGWQVWTSIGAGLACVTALQLWFWHRSVKSAERTLARGKLALARPWLVSGLVLLPSVVVEKWLYATADLNRDKQITHLARLFPLYARLPMTDIASNLGVPPEEPAPAPLDLEGYELDYPHALPAIDLSAPRPNILILVIDCLRADRLTPEFMPHLSAFAEDARVFDDHVSGGNSTRFGLFSLLYGIHGSYWFPVLKERRSPVLIDALLDRGYEFGIYGSASMDYPEMRDTLWASIPDAVHDDFGDAPSWRRDELAAQELIDWFGNRSTLDAPFFGFLLLDAPHQTYSYPPDQAPFQPAAGELDYMSLTTNVGPDPELLERVRNRYDNAVHHADRVAGRVLEAIRASEHFADTVVIVTGDHGEEFMEPRFFGHTSAFTPAQLRVPFVLRGPGIRPGLELGPTSHLDVAPTLLEHLGANPAGRASWCLGQNLLDPVPDRRRVFGAWSELGIWAPAGILRVPLSRFEFNLECYDYRWDLIVDDRELLSDEADALERLGAECNRFLR